MAHRERRLPRAWAGLGSMVLALGMASAGSQSPAAPTAEPIVLEVDATDVERRLFRVHEVLPVHPGELVLRYPEWLPGKHAPRGPIESLAGLTLRAGNATLEWTRGASTVYDFHTNIPAGVSRLEVEFQYASPLVPEQGRITTTPEIAGLEWTSVFLYPAGPRLDAIPVQASVRLPQGWEFGCALEVAGREAGLVRFHTTDADTLTDSPLFAGRWTARLDLDPGAPVPVHLFVVADAPNLLAIRPEQLAAHRALVQQLYGLFGPPHYDHYDALLALSESFGEIGLEHLRSSENRETPGYFTEWERRGASRGLLPHEMAHSWNGKFRRPVGLSTADFNQPMVNDLLWVYEGLSEYLETVLAARSGLYSAEFAREQVAYAAALMDRDRPGRTWRPLADTTLQPIVTARRALSWPSWQRTEDYYIEGLLLWLDVDTRIRELSGDKRSLDDFARSFFQVGTGQRAPVTYTLDDVVRGLDAVAPFAWRPWLEERLRSRAERAPLDGLARGGWQLVYTEAPSDYVRSLEEERGDANFLFSLGLYVRPNGVVTEVRWGSPADQAGMTLGTTLLSVNGREYRPERLREAVAGAAQSHAPLEFIVRSGDRYRVVHVAWFEGLRYPLLRRIDRTPDRLSRILRPRTS